MVDDIAVDVVRMGELLIMSYLKMMLEKVVLGIEGGWLMLNGGNVPSARTCLNRMLVIATASKMYFANLDFSPR